MEQFVGDTRKLKISSEKAVRPRLGNEVFWIQGNESKQDLYLLCVYATNNY